MASEGLEVFEQSAKMTNCYIWWGGHIKLGVFLLERKVVYRKHEVIGF